MTLSDFRNAYRTHVRKHIVEFLDTLTLEDFNQPAILVTYVEGGPLFEPQYHEEYEPEYENEEELF